MNHRFLLEHYGADYPLEALIAAWGRHFRVLAAAGLPLKPGAAELLDLLDELRCRGPSPRRPRMPRSAAIWFRMG